MRETDSYRIAKRISIALRRRNASTSKEHYQNLFRIITQRKPTEVVIQVLLVQGKIVAYRDIVIPKSDRDTFLTVTSHEAGVTRSKKYPSNNDGIILLIEEVGNCMSIEYTNRFVFSD